MRLAKAGAPGNRRAHAGAMPGSRKSTSRDTCRRPFGRFDPVEKRAQERSDADLVHGAHVVNLHARLRERIALGGVDAADAIMQTFWGRTAASIGGRKPANPSRPVT